MVEPLGPVSSHWGQVGSYDGGGFVQDLAPTEQDSFALLKPLFDNLWLDRATRADVGTTPFHIILGDLNFRAVQQANLVLAPAYFVIYDTCQTHGYLPRRRSVVKVLFISGWIAPRAPSSSTSPSTTPTSISSASSSNRVSLVAFVAASRSVSKRT